MPDAEGVSDFSNVPEALRPYADLLSKLPDGWTAGVDFLCTCGKFVMLKGWPKHSNSATHRAQLQWFNDTKL